MKFSEVSHYFVCIETTSSRLGVTRLLAELFAKTSAQESAILCNISLGQLHAPYIGTQFNMAEKHVAKAIALVLDTTEQWVLEEIKKRGDVGLVLDDGTWVPTDGVSVEQVYHALCAIEQTGGTGSQEEKVAALVALLKSVDPVSAKFIVRIIVGKLRLGFSDMTIIDALSWMISGDKSHAQEIEDAYNMCADIGMIAKTVKEKGVQGVTHIHAQVGIPIRPAAAERLPTAKAIFEKLGPCIAQPKLDGFRLQIHVDNTGAKPVIRFFSRNLQDMSAMFPDIAAAVATLPVKNIICEGEAIGYDANTGLFARFQETVKRKRKHGIEQAVEDLPLRVFLFDLLYLNGQELLEKTHEERYDILRKTFTGLKQDILHVLDEAKVATAQELESYFHHNIALGLEGIVVKRPDAIYQPGKRNFNWIKLKRQEEGELEDTIDCIILGYYAGEGKRAQWGIGAFLVGVFNKQNDRFETIAKIGTGLSDLDWVDLKNRCEALKVSQQPKNVVCAKELAPDVWTVPQIVCVIRADEITLSPMHAAGKTETSSGYALRFPRFVGYSIDKGPEEATTVDEVIHLYQDQFVK